MNNSLPSIGDGLVGEGFCDTCGHPLSVHDATGLRWCAATKLGVGTRRCICSSVPTEGWVLTHY